MFAEVVELLAVTVLLLVVLIVTRVVTAEVEAELLPVDVTETEKHIENRKAYDLFKI